MITARGGAVRRPLSLILHPGREAQAAPRGLPAPFPIDSGVESRAYTEAVGMYAVPREVRSRRQEPPAT